MRNHPRSLAAALLATAALTACKDSSPSPAPLGEGQGTSTAVASRGPGAMAAAQKIRGTLAEKMDSGGYTYLRITTASGEVWAAVPQTQVTVGADVDVAVQMTMEAFASKTLNRTFDKIIFGTLAGGAPAMPAAVSTGGSPTAPAAPVAPVAKAAGPSGKTVAEIFEGKAKLKDTKVSVHARVVKVTEGVLGKNWLHLKDGSGAQGSDDITVTTTSRAAVGDIVTIHGVVHLDRDFGAGYAYPVLIEEATLEM